MMDIETHIMSKYHFNPIVPYCQANYHIGDSMTEPTEPQYAVEISLLNALNIEME
jgi:hypothetical protein